MGETSKIEWTDATWNPVTGCSIVSPGCTNCYAMKLAGGRLRNHASRKCLTKPSNAGQVWTGEVRFNEQWLTQPLTWRAPRMIFVCAHGDLFHPDVPDAWIDRVFAVMALAPHHTFQVLTKRPERMRAFLTTRNGMGNSEICRAINQIPNALGNRRGALSMPLPNVWLGVSAERQQEADGRIPHLLATPAAVRFLSAEPLLGPMTLTKVIDRISGGAVDSLGGVYWRAIDKANGPPHGICDRLDWVIVGGESGAKARPMHPDWARSLRDQCKSDGVPFFFKQWGEWAPWEPEHGPCWVSQHGRSEDHHALFPTEMDDDPNWDDGLWAVDAGEGHAAFQRIGKKASGRLLDGVTHDGMPEVAR